MINIADKSGGVGYQVTGMDEEARSTREASPNIYIEGVNLFSLFIVQPQPPPSLIICHCTVCTPLPGGAHLWSLELQTKVLLKVPNHGEGPY